MMHVDQGVTKTNKICGEERKRLFKGEGGTPGRFPFLLSRGKDERKKQGDGSHSGQNSGGGGERFTHAGTFKCSPTM